MNNGRDCPHGRQVGKCDTCDLIEAEKEIEALKAQVEQLQQELSDEQEMVSNYHDTNSALAAQVEALLEPAKEAAEALGFASHHLRGRASENMLMDMAEKADALISAIDSTPTQCLSEIKAQAGRDGFIAGCLNQEKSNLRAGYLITKAADEYANQLRQQAKGE